MPRSFLKPLVLLFLILLPTLLPRLSPPAKSFPSALSTDSSLFMVKFRQIYDYVHKYLNVKTFALENPFYTDSYVNSPERWNLAYFALLLTYAYSLTGDGRYLLEAKYFVDNLNLHIRDLTHESLDVNTSVFDGWLYADSTLLWAMARLHEFGYGDYLSIINRRINIIMNHAAINDTSHLAFYYVWYASGDITLNTYMMFSYLLSYLTKQGLGNYQTDVQKMIDGWESQRLPNNLFPYNWNQAYSHDSYSVHIVMAEIFAKHLLPALTVDTAKIQLSINAFETSSYGNGDPYLALMALKEGYSVGQKLRTQWKEYLEDQRFDQRTFQNVNAFPAGHRTIMYGSIGLVYLFYYSALTNDYPFADGGYTKWFDGVEWHYGFNNTAAFRVTRTDVNYGFTVRFDSYRLMRFWSGIKWDFDTLAYDSAAKYWRGFKEGVGGLSGQNLTLDIFPENQKVIGRRNIINTNAVYQDSQIEAEIGSVGKIYLYFPNQTSFNVTAVTTTAYLNVPEYWAWVQQNGYMFVYKMENGTGSEREIRIAAWGSTGRAVRTAATYVEACPFAFGGTNSTEIKQKQMSILQQIANGVYEWDETFPVQPEGSIKWQLKHYSDTSVYTDKNMTGSTYSPYLLTIDVNASAGLTSTTLVYTGDLGKPTNVTGATSYNYNQTSKILTVTKTHSNPTVAEIIINWSLFPDILSTNDSLFMQKFQQIYNYIHKYLNTTNFTLEDPYYTDYVFFADPEINVPERQNLAYFALILTFAYSYTGDAQYLVEAKYFVDNLNRRLYDSIHYSLDVNLGHFTGYLYADSMLLWAMVRLHEFGYGNYLDTVKQRISIIFDHAAINTSQHLAWYFVWHASQTQDLRLHAYTNFPYLLAYMTKQGLADYTPQIQKIIDGWESRRRPDNLFPDDWNDAFTNAPNSVPIITAEIFLKYLLPQLNVNSTKIQLSLNAIEASPLSTGYQGEPIGNGDPTLAYTAMKNGYTIGQKMRTQWQQYIKDHTFEERSLQSKNFFPSGHRAVMYGMLGLIFWYYFDAQTSDYSFAEGGYTKWFDGSTWHYGFNNTVGINTTRVDVKYGISCRAYTYSFLTFWYGVNWDFTSLTYNSTSKYWTGFRQGTGSLAGQNLTLYMYPEMRKVIAMRNVINDNPSYTDRQVSADLSAIKQIYLYFPNGSYYNVTSIAGTTYLKVPEYFAWVHPSSGEMFIYKMQNYTDTANRWIKIVKQGNIRTLSTKFTYSEVYTFKFWGGWAPGTSTAGIKEKQISILQQINEGTYSWDETFPLSPEGSARSQLKHYAEVSIYTDKNMTYSSFSPDFFAVNITAPAQQASTTVVYTGSKGEPASLIGATSYSYNSTNRLLTISVTHTSAIPVQIVVTWQPDIAVLNLVASKTIVGQGLTLDINVTVANQGTKTEAFSVDVYANTTSVSSQNIVLEGDNSTTITFTWNTTGFARGNYTIKAYATPLPSEGDTADNEYVDGDVIIAIIGDINGPTSNLPDGKVDIIDLATIGVAFSSHPGHPQWNPNADINNDLKIDIDDLIVCAINYGKTAP